MPEGNYQIELGFVEELYRTSGKRIFDVNINGQAFLDNFDIYKEFRIEKPEPVPGKSRKTASAPVLRSMLAYADSANIVDIEFITDSSSEDKALVNVINLYDMSGALVSRINCGFTEGTNTNFVNPALVPSMGPGNNYPTTAYFNSRTNIVANPDFELTDPSIYPDNMALEGEC